MSENERILKAPIVDEMKEAYVDYAMSVIVARALPDVRDGLKPVHRRILYTMNEEHITYDKKFRKSAATVGNVLARYHPHGDAAVYDAMVRLAQPFNTRYPLVAPQGNFGSIDGDSPAHMRYTEAKLARISNDLLRDLAKDTVDWTPNFDNTCQEPTVLPTVIPNLLVNGSEGIAVGMATKIPPHNLGEVIDASLALLADENATVDDLMKYIIGPDFPTGALIMGKRGIRDTYTTGRGCITQRAVMDVEEIRKDKDAIVVTEIPYQVNKADMLVKIADAVKAGRIEGITDLRDESNREGIRIVIELAKNARPKVVMSQLYKYSDMECNYNAILLALVDNVPRLLTLKEMLQHFLNHRRSVVTRRTQFDLKKAQDRDHIVIGLLQALDHIDEIITIIRSSSDVDTARNALMERFGFSERQAQAILDMRLQRLTGLERNKLEEEHQELLKTIAYLQGLLADPLKMNEVIRTELLEVRARFGDERRTRIVLGVDGTDMRDEDLIPNVPVVVTMSNGGYLKRVPIDTFKTQKRGGKGISGTALKEEDFLADFFVSNTHNYLLFFTNKGRMYRIKVYDVPEFGRSAKGTNVVNLLKLGEDERVAAVIPLTCPDQEGSLISITRKGLIKRTPLSAYRNVRAAGLIALKMRDDDELVSVMFSPQSAGEVDEDIIEDSDNAADDDISEADAADAADVADVADAAEDGDDSAPASASSGNDLMIFTRNGRAARISEESVPLRGRASLGVKGIKLVGDDVVVSMDHASNGNEVLVVTEKGFAKCSRLDEYPCKRRGWQGVRNINGSPEANEKLGHIAAVLMVNCNRTDAEMANKDQVVEDAEDATVANVEPEGSVLDNDEIMVSSSKGTLIRTRVAEIRLCGRSSMGVRIMRLADDDVITAVARIIPSEAIAAEAEQDKANVRAMNDALAGLVEMSASDPRYQESETFGALTMGRDDAEDTSEWELLRRAEEQEQDEQ
ncbi:DNA gyrase subunit A [bacterium]|nr:DNA gyrase subunit A [bacterium]